MLKFEKKKLKVLITRNIKTSLTATKVLHKWKGCMCCMSQFLVSSSGQERHT
jgi:hypothetical protein